MRDLLGVLALGGNETPLLSAAWLPVVGCPLVGSPRTEVVSSGRLSAVFVPPDEGPATHARIGSRHVFCTGEARPRHDSGMDHCGPLSAVDLLVSFQAKGESFFSTLKGNFALALADEADPACLLVQGSFSISPFYYSVSGSKCVFSTSLAAVGLTLALSEIDQAAVAETALFNYPLGGRTLLRGVWQLRPAEIVRWDVSGLRRTRWWQPRQLYESPMLPLRQALEVGSELFHATVNDRVAQTARVRVSFTSGFDSRAILAVLRKNPADVLAYSFGIPGSVNVEVPQAIAQELGIHYEPVLLDEAYERVFDENAFAALLLSDCLSTVERANYPYAFRKLASFAPVVLTGLFGSELLRTFQNVGHIVSEALVRLNLASDPLGELRRLLTGGKIARYFNDDLVRAAAPEVEADVEEVLVGPWRGLGPDRRFYMFLLTEGLRKYFGAEVHMERPWGVNRFPFFDDEFVEFAFRSPFAGVHSRTIRPTVANRFRSQYFYAYLIRKYRPELLRAPTDHGYPPADVLSDFPLLRIGPKVLWQRWRRRRMGYREFKTEEWTQGFYHRHLFRKPARDDLFAPVLRGDFASGRWLEHRLEFARAASLKLWLEALEQRGIPV